MLELDYSKKESFQTRIHVENIGDKNKKELDGSKKESFQTRSHVKNI